MARYVIVLQPESGDSRPDAVRLRQALKYLGRACRLRCVEVRPEQLTNENQAAVPAKETGCPRNTGVQNDTTK